MSIMFIGHERLVSTNLTPCGGPKTAPKGWRPVNVENIGNVLDKYFSGSIKDDHLALALKNQGIQAVCFDLDGTLFNSEEAGWQTVEQGCKNNTILSDADIKKIDLTADDKQRYIGTATVDFLTNLFTELHIEDAALKAKAISDTKIRILEELLNQGRIQDFGKIINLAKTLYSNGFKVALVTSSKRDSVDLILKHFGLNQCFTQIITRENMNGRFKPDPYAYNLAMNKLSVKPHQTLVFEDSDPGIKSARDAGTVVVALRNTKEQKLTELRHHNIIPMDLAVN